jgi:hypothetical protein
MKNFLSIDVDYFNDFGPEAFEKCMKFIIKNFPKEKISFITNHHQILRYTNTHEFDQLIQIDKHTDLCVDNGIFTDLNCGTWCKFVKDKDEKEYLWIYPFTEKSVMKEVMNEGDCNAWNPIFPRKTSFVAFDKIGYKKIRMKRNFSYSWLKKILTESVHVSMCRSPMYTRLDIQKRFLKIAKDNEIPVLRGLMKE